MMGLVIRKLETAKSMEFVQENRSEPGRLAKANSLEFAQENLSELGRLAKAMKELA